MASIDPDRWKILSPYLDEGLDRSPDERAAWLATIRTRDASLAAELQSMLAEHDHVSDAGFLDGTVVDPRIVPDPSLEGQVVGAYRLVSLIGRGGTGSVWLADRCDGRFHGQAAVKLLDMSLVARAGEERFRREGTILARLRHPRIAHLVDAGVLPTGQPYLVLEHVNGLTIDRYCDERRLGIDDRLRLFLDVLDAVAHAHANLIVHRDIKPGNVLVSTDGQVKLLDFGIAKLVEPADWQARRSRESSTVSREIGRALTPEYAAPEQVSGGDVTTATDIYALGVLLYVLLSGRHPAAGDIHTPETLMRAILLTEPAPLSDAAVSRGDSPETFAEHATRCRTSPTGLRRTLRGDLDAIVAKALKKNPADRYGSVTAFADDLRRFLASEPIAARPATIGYRAVKFVRRRAAIVAASAIVVLGVAVLTTVHTQRLAAERDRSQREAAKAVKVSDLLMGLLTSVDPFAIPTRSGEPTVRGLLDRGAQQVRRDLAGEPLLQVELLTMMGRTYRRLGEYDRARELLEEALLRGEQDLGANHVRVAQTLDALGVVLAEKGDYAGAGRSLERALALRRTLLGSSHEDVAVTLAELGRVHQDQGFNDRAEPLHREALAIRRTTLGEGDRETAVSLSDLASVLRLNGDNDAAEPLLRQSLAINRRTRGEDHPNTATSMHDLALIAASRGDYRAAEAQLESALAMQRRALGNAHPIVAVTLNTLSHVMARTNRPEGAAAALREALDIVRPALGTEHQLVAIYSINSAAVQMTLGRPDIAEGLLREGLRVRSLAPGIVPSRRRFLLEDDWTPGATRSLLGESLIALARYEEAEEVLLEARRNLQALGRPRPGDLKRTLERLVQLYVKWGKPDRAAEHRALLASS